MSSFDGWRPKKLLEHGNQQVSAARHLLALSGVELDQARRDEAEDLLTEADDFKEALPRKSLPKRIVLARRYSRKADGALRTIQGMPVRRIARFIRRPCRA